MSKSKCLLAKRPKMLFKKNGKGRNKKGTRRRTSAKKIRKNYSYIYIYIYISVICSREQAGKRGHTGATPRRHAKPENARQQTAEAQRYFRVHMHILPSLGCSRNCHPNKRERLQTMHTTFDAPGLTRVPAIAAAEPHQTPPPFSMSWVHPRGAVKF